MRILTDRIIRAVTLDVRLYQRVKTDKKAMGQATAAVLLSSLAAGIGTIARAGFGGLITGTILALIRWCIWASLTYLIGTRLLPESRTKEDIEPFARTVGFSAAPGLIRVFGIVPPAAELVFLVADMWMLVAMVIAVRQALDYLWTERAVGACVPGWIVSMVIGFWFYA
jgi:hypothetical protein